MRTLLLLAGSSLAALALTGSTATSQAATGAMRDLDQSFWSRALDGPMHFDVFLPASYSRTKTRFPVIYVLHGLPAATTSYRETSFAAQALRTTHRTAIIVAPQGARDNDSDPEYHDWGNGRDWETAITKELVRVVDNRFRTVRSRAGRALIGFSAGGYGAAVLGLHHLDEYAVVESWSGYFHATDPTGHYTLNLGSTTANRYGSVHALVPRLRREFRAHPTFLAFYVGDQDFFAPENVRLDRELTSAGVWHVFRVYHGGHQRSLWQANAPRWLELALLHMAQ